MVIYLMNHSQDTLGHLYFSVNACDIAEMVSDFACWDIIQITYFEIEALVPDSLSKFLTMGRILTMFMITCGAVINELASLISLAKVIQQ